MATPDLIVLDADLVALKALYAFLHLLPEVDRVTLEAALAEISGAVQGVLPVPCVREGVLTWEVPEGSVCIRVADGRLEWWASYNGHTHLGDRVRAEEGSPEAVFGIGLLDFLRKVLLRRSDLEDLRAKLLRELKATTDPHRLLAYLSGSVQLPEPQTVYALPAPVACVTYADMGYSEEDKALGKLAFDAYAREKGGVTYDGKPIPSWEEVGYSVQSGWIVAALAVKYAVLGE